MRADLHSHSIYSDGKYTLRNLVKHAKERNIDVLALTDHDTVLGDEEIIKYGEEFNVKIIKGIELTCKHKNRTVHIVGLFKNNIVPKKIYEYSVNKDLTRRNRAINMSNKLIENYNLKIDIDELLNNNRIITRKNILDHIMAKNNLSYDEAKFYVSHDSLAYIPSEKLEAIDGIKLLHENNAIAILAHPCLISDHNVMLEVVDMPFDGIEAKYANIKNDYEYYKNMAIKNNFFISAGSDFHGDKSHGDIGDVYLEGEEVTQVLNKLGL